MVNAIAKMVSNHTDPVVLTLMSAELNLISVEIMQVVSMYQALFDVNVYPVMWEHLQESNVKLHAKMLNVVNMHIVNQTVQMPIASVKKVGRIIRKILPLVALKSMNVILLENVLVHPVLLVRYLIFILQSTCN